MVQLSHIYMTTVKTIGLTIQTFVGKVMSLFFNMLSRSVIVVLPRSECFFLISWLQVSVLSDSGAQENRICLYFFSTFPPSICHEVMGPDATILVF